MEGLIAALATPVATVLRGIHYMLTHWVGLAPSSGETNLRYAAMPASRSVLTSGPGG